MLMRCLVCLLLLPALAQAQMYRWLDDSGKVHYSDQAPPPNAKNVQKKPMAASPGTSSPLPYGLQQAAKNFAVTLYTSEPCIPCVQARELLKQRGVPYQDVIVTDNEGLEKLKKLTGTTAVPVMTVGREVHKGFEMSAYQAALDNAGYPRTSQLPAGTQARQVAKPAQKDTPAASASETRPPAESAPAPGASPPR